MLVSVIILSWNRKNEILKTLEDLKRQTYKNFEIIVVDQVSTDGTLEAIEELFSDAKIIRLHKNFGVPGGRNIGIANAKGNILVFLDNDASLNERALEIVVKRFSMEDSLGIIGFKILNATTGKLDLSSWAYQKVKIKDEDMEFRTYSFCGGASAIKKGVFEKVGYYWDELFWGWEEIELSIRVLDAGYAILYLPSIIVNHRISKENKTNRNLAECIRLKNSLWVLWRCMPIAYSLKESLIRVPAYFVKAIRYRCFLKMLLYFFSSFRKIGLLFSSKYRISKITLEKYKKLSSRGPILEQTKYLFLK